MTSIEAFRIALGRAESGVSEEALNSRKIQARQTAFAYMPSLQGRFAPRIKERLVAENGNLWLAFDLVPPMQMHLALDGNPKANVLDIEATCKLREEYARLLNEASEFVVRSGQLITLASALPQLDAASRIEAIESLAHEDSITWESMHRLSGRELSIKFGDEMLSAHLPQLNPYLTEPANRIIVTKVSKIREKSYKLTSIRDISTDVNQVKLPASMSMERPRKTFPAHAANKVSSACRRRVWCPSCSRSSGNSEPVESNAGLSGIPGSKRPHVPAKTSPVPVG